MAVVSPVPATTQRMGSVRSLRDIGANRVMASREEIMEEPNQAVVVDQPIYVAVSKDVKESKVNVIWAIQNSGGKRICILYIHVPATMIPLSKFAPYMCMQYSSLYGFVFFNSLIA